ncbi:MAG: hypothetical protein V3S68_04860 [Dehalococcoidia bacterium]
MAREAYRSLYGDLTKLKDSSLLKDPGAGTGDDDELWQLLMATSDWVDHYCNRRFFPYRRTLEFTGPGAPKLQIEDVIEIDSVKEDTTRNASFATTWAATDYHKFPHIANPTDFWGTPFTSLILSEATTKASFAEGTRRFQIVGLWGYRRFIEASGTLLNDAGMDTSKTTIAVDDGTKFEIGQTIFMNDELMLISGISSNDLTVTRGLNNTIAIAHTDNDPVSILRLPPAIERAALIQAARLWTRAAAFEPFYVSEKLDPDIKTLLAPYRKLPI